MWSDEPVAALTPVPGTVALPSWLNGVIPAKRLTPATIIAKTTKTMANFAGGISGEGSLFIIVIASRTGTLIRLTSYSALSGWPDRPMPINTSPKDSLELASIRRGMP